MAPSAASTSSTNELRRMLLRLNLWILDGVGIGKENARSQNESVKESGPSQTSSLITSYRAHSLMRLSDEFHPGGEAARRVPIMMWKLVVMCGRWRGADCSDPTGQGEGSRLQ